MCKNCIQVETLGWIGYVDWETFVADTIQDEQAAREIVERMLLLLEGEEYYDNYDDPQFIARYAITNKDELRKQMYAHFFTGLLGHSPR